MATARDRLQGSLDALESSNEYDLRGGADWATDLRPYQQHLYETAQADPYLSTLPLIGPSVVRWSQQDQLGDVSELLDYGNIHSYPDGYFPESNLGSHLANATGLSGSRPVMATETGWHTALNWTDSHKPASEQAVATYMPRLFLEYFRRGVARTFSYQLLDHWQNPELDERELHFGLLRNDLSATPAFVALRNTISILGDDPGAGLTRVPWTTRSPAPRATYARCFCRRAMARFTSRFGEPAASGTRSTAWR